MVPCSQNHNLGLVYKGERAQGLGWYHERLCRSVGPHQRKISRSVRQDLNQLRGPPVMPSAHALLEMLEQNTIVDSKAAVKTESARTGKTGSNRVQDLSACGAEHRHPGVTTWNHQKKLKNGVNSTLAAGGANLFICQTWRTTQVEDLIYAERHMRQTRYAVGIIGGTKSPVRGFTTHMNIKIIGN